jgi:hypothetical protein
MRVRRFLLGVGILITAAVIFATAGLGATPNQIYLDLADNGRLDRTYTAADLEAALANPSLQGYRSPTVAVRRDIQRRLAAPKTLRQVRQQGGLPFTGFDLALLGFGGAFLLTAGGIARRAVRAQDN